MWLHEYDQATEEEKDALACRILTALYKAWCWDHGIEGEVVVTKIEDPPEEAG